MFLSKDEVSHILGMEKAQDDGVAEVTKESQLESLLGFSRSGMSFNKYDINSLNNDVDSIDFIKLFENIDFSKVNIPKDEETNINCLTIEKYKEMVDIILQKLKNNEEIDLHEMYREQNLDKCASWIKLK